MNARQESYLRTALLASALLMVLLVISYFTRGIAIATTVLSIAIIFFEITIPFEVLKRLNLRPRDANIYAHNIDTTLDLLFPPFGRMRNKPDFQGAKRELTFFLIFSIAIFAPYVICYWAYFKFTAASSGTTLVVNWNFPPMLWYEVITQIFVVALPEEIFYRGFLQSALMRTFPARGHRAWLMGTAVILTNIIFALGHVASTLNPMRLLTFFPGLLFSYLVLRNKSLLSAILFHAACNILGQILYASFYLL